jgi:hypothetical protein
LVGEKESKRGQVFFGGTCPFSFAHHPACYNFSMPLLIDGYNLLHVTGLVGHGNEPTALNGAREALLRFLAAAIEPAERSNTTIVFDAAGAPPGGPRLGPQASRRRRRSRGRSGP